MNNIEKKSFKIDSFKLECNETIPVELGYETYGTLNEDKSNVILVAHYFSASSHAAGKYHESDPIVGYWDNLIGPDKAIDTNKYFVISIDNLANVQANNPYVITTGPRSINPETNKRWGLDFPAFTFKDVARIQHQFLTEQLNIDSLAAVIGASAGGFIGMNWAIEFPDLVKKYIGVITNPQNPIITSFDVLQHAMRAIELDPKWNNGDYEDDQQPLDGLALAIQMMNVGAFSPQFFEDTYQRDSKDSKPYQSIKNPNSYEVALGNAINATIGAIDANHWYYTCRATMMHDVAYPEGSLAKALGKIKADVLMVSCVKDLLQPTIFNEQMVEIMKDNGQKIELFTIDSDKGHMAGILDTDLYADKVREFLNK